MTDASDTTSVRASEPAVQATPLGGSIPSTVPSRRTAASDQESEYTRVKSCGAATTVGVLVPVQPSHQATDPSCVITPGR